MSKASEWAAILGKCKIAEEEANKFLPKRQRGRTIYDFCKTIKIRAELGMKMVDDKPTPYIYFDYPLAEIGRSNALKLAKWIQDTFGEDE